MANITRLNPFDDLFNDFGKGFWLKPMSGTGESELTMKVDVKEDDRGFLIKADIPGVKKEDIQIDVEDDRVSLCAEIRQEKDDKKGEKIVYSERRYGIVRRSFRLPASVDANDAKAEYRDGVLSVTLSKKRDGSSKRIIVM